MHLIASKLSRDNHLVFVHEFSKQVNVILPKAKKRKEKVDLFMSWGVSFMTCMSIRECTKGGLI